MLKLVFQTLLLVLVLEYYQRVLLRLKASWLDPAESAILGGFIVQLFDPDIIKLYAGEGFP